MIVLDTSALIYWTLDRPRLSSAAAQEIAGADRIAISSISIWEIGIKVSMGKLAIPLPVQEYADRLRHIDRVEILAVDLRTWLKNLELDWSHRDPADRTIVATATLLSCPLLSSDSIIRKFYPPTVW